MGEKFGSVADKHRENIALPHAEIEQAGSNGTAVGIKLPISEHRIVNDDGNPIGITCSDCARV